MSNNEFKLDSGQLKEIALDYQRKIETGLKHEKGEVGCRPAFIHPLTTKPEGQATVIDLTGTTCRAAVISFAKGKAKFNPKGVIVKDLEKMQTHGFTAHELLSMQSEFINQIKLPEKSPVGYCFSYPVKYVPDGDAELISWTGGVEIGEMIGKPVGKTLLAYLNQKGEKTFTGIKVINDTLACLFAGLSDVGFDAYIGVNVGTETRMACFIDAENISLIKGKDNWSGLTPVILESGGFNPPHLTEFDRNVAEKSENHGFNRFDMAVSGAYLGKIFKELFPEDELNEKFEARGITDVINRPVKYKKRQVKAAKRIYRRSAKLVAASLAGLIDLLITHDNSVRTIKVIAKGNLFWSKVKNCRNYKKTVNRTLNNLLCEMGHNSMKIDISEIENSRMIGTAIAALS